MFPVGIHNSIESFALNVSRTLKIISPRTYLIRWTIHRTVRVRHVAIAYVLHRIVRPQEILRLHFAPQTGDIARAKVPTQLLHLLELQQVYAEDLKGFDHETVELCIVGEQRALLFLY